MTDIAGARVARMQFGTIHVAERWGDPGVVLARCGNVIAHPQWQRLMGARCPRCLPPEQEPADRERGSAA